MVRYLFYTIGDLTYQSPLVAMMTGRNTMEIIWERQKVSRSAEQATSDDYCCNKMDATDNFSLERTGRSGVR